MAKRLFGTRAIVKRNLGQRFGKLSPTNGGAIQVYSDALKDGTMETRLLLSDSTPFFEGPLRITKGKFINAPKPHVHGWITACGRSQHDIRGNANVRNTVYAFRTGGVTNLYLTELDDNSGTARHSRDSGHEQPKETLSTKDASHRPTRRESGVAASSCEPRSIEHLRQSDFEGIPDGPGVYWWYFPHRYLELLGIASYCDPDALQLRPAGNGKICLYVGIAKSLRERIEWHAAQHVNQSALRSGWLSTLRFSIMALAKLNYHSGDAEINCLMDELDVSWTSTQGVPEAETIESAELCGGFHFPLNIRDNCRPETARFIRHLQERRKAYRKQYLY